MLVREFPRVPTVALLTELESNAPSAVLTLGRSGVQTLVDVRQPAGWRVFVMYFLPTNRVTSVGSLSLSFPPISLALTPIAGTFSKCYSVFRAVLAQSVRSRAPRCHPEHAHESLLPGRLPAPKRYLATARLIRAAQLFENPGLSVANVANRLDYSSPQSFGRHVRGLIQLTAVEFRQKYDGEGMLSVSRGSHHPLPNDTPHVHAALCRLLLRREGA